MAALKWAGQEKPLHVLSQHCLSQCEGQFRATWSDTKLLPSHDLAKHTRNHRATVSAGRLVRAAYIPGISGVGNLVVCTKVVKYQSVPFGSAQCRLCHLYLHPPLDRTRCSSVA